MNRSQLLSKGIEAPRAGEVRKGTPKEQPPKTRDHGQEVAPQLASKAGKKLYRRLCRSHLRTPSDRIL